MTFSPNAVSPDLHDLSSPTVTPAEAGRRARHGRLRVYLGAAPGVGKTFAMLQDAQVRRAEGVDVVAGVVETHGRQETEALTEGLEFLPKPRRNPNASRIGVPS